MSENWRQSKICIVINDKSEGTTAKHLSCDGLLHHKFIIQFAGESIFKIGEHIRRSYKVDCVIRPIHPRLLSSKMQNRPHRP